MHVSGHCGRVLTGSHALPRRALRRRRRKRPTLRSEGWWPRCACCPPVAPLFCSAPAAAACRPCMPPPLRRSVTSTARISPARRAPPRPTPPRPGAHSPLSLRRVASRHQVFSCAEAASLPTRLPTCLARLHPHPARISAAPSAARSPPSATTSSDNLSASACSSASPVPRAGPSQRRWPGLPLRRRGSAEGRPWCPSTACLSADCP